MLAVIACKSHFESIQWTQEGSDASKPQGVSLIFRIFPTTVDGKGLFCFFICIHSSLYLLNVSIFNRCCFLFQFRRVLKRFLWQEPPCERQVYLKRSTVLWTIAWWITEISSHSYTTSACKNFCHVCAFIDISKAVDKRNYHVLNIR